MIIVPGFFVALVIPAVTRLLVIPGPCAISRILVIPRGLIVIGIVVPGFLVVIVAVFTGRVFIFGAG